MMGFHKETYDVACFFFLLYPGRKLQTTVSTNLYFEILRKEVIRLLRQSALLYLLFQVHLVFEALASDLISEVLFVMIFPAPYA